MAVVTRKIVIKGGQSVIKPVHLFPGECKCLQGKVSF